MASIAPVRLGSRFRCEAVRVALEVDATLGGRVVEFSLDGRNALFADRSGGESHGSTLWTSPQRDWGWPPPPELDRDPYEPLPSNTAISLESRPSRTLGVSIRKHFEMANDGSVAIRYTLRNDSSVARAVAPWEVTRVPRAGVSLFSSDARVRASTTFPAPEFTESNGAVWIDQANAASDDRKLLAETRSSWLAHAAQGLLFVKTFEPRTTVSCAPDEADIEIFVSGGTPYVELEQQGTYRALEPGESATWAVTWRLLDASNAPPRPALADYVRSLLQFELADPAP